MQLVRIVVNEPLAGVNLFGHVGDWSAHEQIVAFGFPPYLSEWEDEDEESEEQKSPPQLMAVRVMEFVMPHPLEQHQLEWLQAMRGRGLVKDFEVVQTRESQPVPGKKLEVVK